MTVRFANVCDGEQAWPSWNEMREALVAAAEAKQALGLNFYSFHCATEMGFSLLLLCRSLFPLPELYFSPLFSPGHRRYRRHLSFGRERQCRQRCRLRRHSGEKKTFSSLRVFPRKRYENSERGGEWENSKVPWKARHKA